MVCRSITEIIEELNKYKDFELNDEYNIIIDDTGKIKISSFVDTSNFDVSILEDIADRLRSLTSDITSIGYDIDSAADDIYGFIKE